MSWYQWYATRPGTGHGRCCATWDRASAETLFFRRVHCHRRRRRYLSTCIQFMYVADSCVSIWNIDMGRPPRERENAVSVLIYLSDPLLSADLATDQHHRPGWLPSGALATTKIISGPRPVRIPRPPPRADRIQLPPATTHPPPHPTHQGHPYTAPAHT